MRPLQLSLIALGVAAALALSVLLVLRNLPGETPQAAVPEQVQATEQAAQDEPAVEEAAPEVTASAPVPAVEEILPRPPAAAPVVEPLIAKPAGTQGSPFEPLILPPSGLSGGRIAALPPAPDGAPVERTARFSLSAAQEEKLRYVLQSHNIMQTEVGDFPLRPGSAVPKEVHLTPLPIELANVVPNYRSYSYVFAQDRIVIVLTDSREIGFVLPL